MPNFQIVEAVKLDSKRQQVRAVIIPRSRLLAFFLEPHDLGGLALQLLMLALRGELGLCFGLPMRYP